MNKEEILARSKKKIFMEMNVKRVCVQNEMLFLFGGLLF